MEFIPTLSHNNISKITQFYAKMKSEIKKNCSTICPRTILQSKNNFIKFCIKDHHRMHNFTLKCTAHKIIANSSSSYSWEIWPLNASKAKSGLQQ